jgi:hypothetical protein
MRAFAIAALAVLSSGYGLSTLLTKDHSIVERRVAAAAEGIVVVRIPDGAIDIEGWRGAEVEVTGSLARDASRMALSSNHGHVQIVVATGEREDRDETHLHIRVPRGSSLDVETDGATVKVNGVDGIVRMQSESGDLTIDGRPLGVVARSETGDIDIGADRAPGIAHSEHGTVRLRGRSAETIARRDPASCRFRRATSCSIARGDSRGYGDLGQHISSIVQRVLQDIDVNGRVDYDHGSGHLDFNVAGSMMVDPADLDALFADLEQMLGDLQQQLGDGMMVLGEELQNIGVDLKQRRP